MTSKGVSPIVATLILTVVVSGFAVIIYNYGVGVFNVLPNEKTQTNSVLENLKAVEVNAFRDQTVHLYVLNTGTVSSIIDMFYIKDWNGSIIEAVPVNVTVGVGETKQVIFDGAGSNVWSWNEIIGVTERGNQFVTNLYGSSVAGINYAYGLGPAPGQGQSEILYNVYRVTVNGTDIPSQSLQNLTSVDGIVLSIPTQNMTFQYMTFPSSSYAFDAASGSYNPVKQDVSNLAVADGNPNTVQYEVKTVNSSTCVMSGLFYGRTTNSRYPLLGLTYIFDLNNKRWITMQGTVQFYDWSSNAYVTSGNGFFTFDQNNGTWTSYNFLNITASLNRGNFIDDSGNYAIMINITTDQPTTVKMDYLAVTEKSIYSNGLETVFYFNVSANVANPANVTGLIFSTTGIFPIASSQYYFSVFNFNLNAWQYFGIIQGNSAQQSFINEITSNCSNYISGSKMIEMRFSPVWDLPTSSVLQIDQTRLLLWMNN